jgi:hypothetical protein
MVDTSNSKISQPQVTIFLEYNVLGFDVPMDNPLAVHILKG